MKIALGIISRPVESLLVLCLRPVISHFDGLIIHTSEYPAWEEEVLGLVHHPRVIHLNQVCEWRSDYAEARNRLIGHAQELGYDWLLMLDADESMLPDDLITMRKYMETEESLILSRYEFVDDFEHFVPSFYPDYQARAFKLNIGYHYEGVVHEQLCKEPKVPASTQSYSTWLPMCPIFHYGKSKPADEVWVKYANYPRIAAGMVPLTEVPPDTNYPKTWALDKKRIRFLGNKPL